MVAYATDVGLVAHQLQIPRTVYAIAVGDGAEDVLFLDDELLVHAARRVPKHDLLRGSVAGKIPGGKKIDARDLELGRRKRRHITRIA